MNQEIKPSYRHKHIKGVFIILLAAFVALAINTILIYVDRNVDTEAFTADVSLTAEYGSLPKYTFADIERHNTTDSCWMSAYGKVFDLTEEIAKNDHPGGRSTLVSGCGKEMTEVFSRIHSPQATADLERLLIGILAE